MRSQGVAEVISLGRTVFIAAPRRDSVGVDSGAVFALYKFGSGPSDWELVATLTPPSASAHGFGRQIAADADTLLVGSSTGVFTYGYSDPALFTFPELRRRMRGIGARPDAFTRG